ncbi:(-)-germacrene D synthase-like [Euphorbia lathyris]|uniref:(-)-germacrene D synthase-like n=1 Tax=Euphorbia lathyris TaxID=212925 RepID=UPI0033142164
MSLQVSADDNRHLADFHPTVWRHHFIHYPFHDTTSMIPSWMNEANVLKEEVRKMITTPPNKSQLLNLVDAIQRLGIAYHFEHEIEEQLHNIFRNQKNSVITDDLHTTALEFRLLRQQGYFVSTDMLNKFKDVEGRFKEELLGDVRGLLSLYEASFLGVHGEDILDEALAFSTAGLNKAHLDSPFSDQIIDALKRPLRRNVERQVAAHYISDYEQDEGHVKCLLKLAKLDFNILQRMEQEELMDISMWWKDLDFATKLPFARDRIVECYFWPLGVFFEPKYGSGRKLLTKTIAIYSTVDDIYDAFGTLQELELYTQVVESFDTSNKEKLPKYMQLNYEGLLDLYKDFEEEITKDGRSEIMFYIKELNKELVRAYMIEARWFNKKHIPTVEEYLKNGYVTSVYPLLTAVSFLGMGEFATKEVFEWLLTQPKILKASAFICRLQDDIVSHKFEQSRGHVASAVECYMKQHGVSEKEAYDGIKKLVENSWKDINEEILKPGVHTAKMPMPLRNCILNFAKVINVVYLDEDGYTDSKNSLKKVLATLLLKPFSI